jgi:formate hydrogenlyase subunit 6/NADH:ubiquinone oxidoreductase subunit I
MYSSVMKRELNAALHADYAPLHVRQKPSPWKVRSVRKGEENLYREEKYARIYEINMLRCIFCGLCEEACPKEAIFLTDRIVPSSFTRGEEIFGKDKLVETMNERIDVSKRQRPEVLEFKKDKRHLHNLTYQDARPKTTAHH